jgi:hypothetical protein
MTNSLDSRESYLYTILLDRTAKQVAMLKKKTAGTLGVWGRSRLEKRKKDIEKLLFHIFTQKNTTYEQIILEIMDDLNYIEMNIATNNDTWAGVGLDELSYLRDLLNDLA